jgi:hypothetical protein
LRLDLAEVAVTGSGGLNKSVRPVTFHFSPNGFGLEKPFSWVGQRNAPGELQMARSAVIESVRRLERGTTEYQNLITQIEDAVRSLQAELNLNTRLIGIRRTQLDTLTGLNDEIEDLRGEIFLARMAAESGRVVTDYASEALPDVAGLPSIPFLT